MNISQQINSILSVGILIVFFVAFVFSLFTSANNFNKLQKDNLVWFANFMADNNSLIFENTELAEKTSFIDLEKSIENQTVIDVFQIVSKDLTEIYTHVRSGVNPSKFSIPVETIDESNKNGVFEGSIYGKTTYFLCVKDEDNTNTPIIGYVVVQANNSGFWNMVSTYLLFLFFVSLLATALAFYLGKYFFVKTIVEPLEALNYKFKNFSSIQSSGNVQIEKDIPIELSSIELRQLTSSFYKMADEISLQSQELSKTNDYLNAEVNKKTKELQNHIASLEEKEKTLRAKNAELAQFAQISSHDLREPLRTIGSFAQLLERKLRKTEVYDKSVAESLQYIFSGAKRMQAVINDVQTFSGINEKPDFVNTDINELIAMAISNSKTLIDLKNGRIEAQQKFPFANVAPSQIIVVFTNLISNGFKFNKSDKPLVLLSYQSKGDYYEFSVKDNGIGIDDDFKDKMFKMFQRNHQQKEFEGTGMGLATCKKIIEIHEGILRYESVKGEGSTFYFTIKKNLNQFSNTIDNNFNSNTQDSFSPSTSLSSYDNLPLLKPL